MSSGNKVYLESTIISYYTGRPSRDVVIAGRQEVTREAWDQFDSKYEIYISELVLNEISQGDKEYSQKRISAVQGIPILSITNDSEDLAKFLIDKNAIPKEYPEDALHIALAAVNGIDYLLTWNFAHINNAYMKYKVQKVIESCEYECPIICTPDELIGE